MFLIVSDVAHSVVMFNAPSPAKQTCGLVNSIMYHLLLAVQYDPVPAPLQTAAFIV